MKRRKFIQAALVTSAAAPAVGMASSRLYGTPGSLVEDGGMHLEKFTVPFVRAGVPSGLWSELSAVATAVEGVLTSRTQALAFADDPKSYLKSKGFDASDRTLLDDSTTLLKCLCERNVQESIAKGDYESALSYFGAAGAVGPKVPSQLQARFEDIMRQNLEGIRAAVAAKEGALSVDDHRLLVESLKASGAHLTEEDLAMLHEVMRAVTTGQATAVTVLVPVFIVAIAALYVSVVVSATVALNVGFTVALAVMLAVVASGQEDQIYSAGRRAPFDGSLMKLDPALMKDAERAIKIARISGKPELEIYAIKRTIRAEVEAFMRAMNNTKLLTMDEKQLELAIDATTAYSLRAVGV